MMEHDDDVGRVLGKIKQPGIEDNTITFYSTDKAPKILVAGWGIIPFCGVKGTTWEGGFRIPSFIKWPGVLSFNRAELRLNDRAELLFLQCQA